MKKKETHPDPLLKREGENKSDHSLKMEGENKSDHSLKMEGERKEKERKLDLELEKAKQLEQQKMELLLANRKQPLDSGKVIELKGLIGKLAVSYNGLAKMELSKLNI